MRALRRPEMQKKMLKREWIGRQVKLLTALETNGGKIFAVGTIMTVSNLHGRGGFNLRKTIICDKCGCGEHHSISAVGERYLELLPVEVAL
jgi:hypothetical protein